MEARQVNAPDKRGLAKYFSEDELLTLRTVSRNWRDMIARLQPAPYENKKQFVLGVSGQFHVFVPHNLAHAWANYQYTMQSDSAGPAVLYKLTDLQFGAFTVNRLAFWEQCCRKKTDGLIYVPPKRRHCWAQNQVWVLAQIHRGRSFEIVSNVSRRNLKRQHDKTVISAFAKEATVAMQAGYTITLSQQGNICLLPPLNHAGLNVSLRDMDIGNKRICDLYARLRTFAAENKIKQNKVPVIVFGVSLFKRKENEDLVIHEPKIELKDFADVSDRAQNMSIVL